MVKFRDDYYVKHYLPYLLNPDVNFDDIYSIDYDDELERMEFLSDEIDVERIDFPEELIKNEIKNTLYELDEDDVIINFIDNDDVIDILTNGLGYPEEVIEAFADLVKYVSNNDELIRIISNPNDDYYEDVIEPYNIITSYYKNFNFDEFKKEIYNAMIDEVIDHLDYYTLEDLLDNIREDFFYMNVYNKLLESALIWNTVFEPEDFDVDTAIYVGLIPFSIYDNNRNRIDVLGIGGAGMDLSPKLDAYQVLLDHSIPENSTFFSDPKYAKYVVGEEVFNEVMKILNE